VYAGRILVIKYEVSPIYDSITYVTTMLITKAAIGHDPGLGLSIYNPHSQSS